MTTNVHDDVKRRRMTDIRHYSPPPDLLKDRIILVTGAGDGIGRAVAKSYAAHGATVVLLGRTISKLEQVYDEIESAGHPQPAIFPLNLETATAKDYDDLGDTIKNEFGRLDGLLNNAAQVGGLTPIQHYNINLWAQIMTINLNAPFLICQVCIPLLEQATDPAIVFSTDNCTRAYWGAYGVAKHGQEALLKILADELDNDRPIRVNGIDTGPVRTQLRAQNYPGEEPTTLPTPEAVVMPYLYFMGSDSKGTTGQNFSFRS
jgi:NAD(P)-dependent dehydrogenase (short-subunit alcohol dehydrogenase family)